MAPTFDSFLEVLRRSGLVDGAALDEQLATAPDDIPAQKFAERLVKSGLLTNWQASKVLQGKFKGFFLGKYRLQKLLGKGGMSSVYLAEHVLMKRRCAIKVLPWKLVKDSSYLKRFHREAQAVAALDHQNIVRAYDIDLDLDGHVEIHYLVMEYIDGRNLFERVQKSGPLPILIAAEYIRQGALGLQHAHDAGLVHRDVKPGNLIVDHSGHVKLMDLGLARLVDQNEESLTLAHDEKVLGTADYLAPEQALDSHLVDARADIYSLGCTFYFLLTGNPPFSEGTLAQRLLAHQTKQPRPVSELRPDLPAALQQIIEKMMLKDREKRTQTASQVAAQLAEWLAQQRELSQEVTPVSLSFAGDSTADSIVSDDSDLRLTDDGRLENGPRSEIGNLVTGSSRIEREEFQAESSSSASADSAPPPAAVPATAAPPLAVSPAADVGRRQVDVRTSPESHVLKSGRKSIVIDERLDSSRIDSQKTTQEIVIAPSTDETRPDRHAMIAAAMIVCLLLGLSVYSYFQGSQPKQGTADSTSRMQSSSEEQTNSDSNGRPTEQPEN